MKVKNFTRLATTRRRELALHIAEAGLEAIDTEKAVKRPRTTRASWSF